MDRNTDTNKVSEEDHGTTQRSSQVDKAQRVNKTLGEANNNTNRPVAHRRTIKNLETTKAAMIW